MKANVTCLSCILSKQDKLTRDICDEEKKAGYFHEVLGVLYRYGQSESALQLAARMDELYTRYFGAREDYSEIKHTYNQLMLKQEEVFEARIRSAKDPIRACIRYVCAGNYIDFSAVEDVNEAMLQTLLDRVEKEEVPEKEYACFLTDLEKAKELAYLTDNCGEIVLDKLFIKILKERYPDLHITVIVRGQDVLNDATMEDAAEVGLTEVTDCMGSGCKTAGTVLEEMSDEARERLLHADVVISKGQGNFESLFGSGVNPYYFFLCKCELFVRRFGLEQYASVFAREDHIRIQTGEGKN